MRCRRPSAKRECYLIQKTLEFLRTMVIQQRVQKVPTQAEAIRTYNYPYQALEEAVANSMYHRFPKVQMKVLKLNGVSETELAS